MRSTSTVLSLLLMLVAVVAAGCRDKVRAPAATAAAPADLAPARLTCASLQSCVENCPREGRTACAKACVERLEPAARPYYQALEACVVPACATAPDGGSSSCDDPTSLGCKMCATARCPKPVSTCLLH